jgi:hypothetical protein
MRNRRRQAAHLQFSRICADKGFCKPLKARNFPLSLSLKNSKKPKTWFGTRGSEVQILSPRPFKIQQKSKIFDVCTLCGQTRLWAARNGKDSGERRKPSRRFFKKSCRDVPDIYPYKGCRLIRRTENKLWFCSLIVVPSPANQCILKPVESGRSFLAAKNSVSKESATVGDESLCPR